MFIIEKLGNTENYQEDNQWFYSKKKKKIYCFTVFPARFSWCSFT